MIVVKTCNKPNLVISCNRWLKENYINHFRGTVWVIDNAALNECCEVWLNPMNFQHYPSTLCGKYLRKLYVDENRRSYFYKKDF